MFLLTWATAAHGGDVAAFWEDTRWSIEIEETTATPIELGAIEDRSFQTRAVQISTVVTCPTSVVRGKKSAEVTCRIDEIAMRATPRSVEQTRSVFEDNAAVLVDIVGRLRGQRVLVSVTDDGRVESTDLPDLTARNRRESEQAEVLSRLMFDVFAGFHLRRDPEWRAGWSEKGSALLRAPTRPAGIASTRIEHSVATVEGAMVVQSTGKGTFSTPYEPWELDSAAQSRITRGASGGTPTQKSSGLGASSAGPATPDDSRPRPGGPGVPGGAPTDLVFEGSVTSVAVVDPETGWPTERVWAMRAAPTASTLGSDQGTTIWYAGRIARLGPGETVPLGNTEVVAPPGAHAVGLTDWQALETL